MGKEISIYIINLFNLSARNQCSFHQNCLNFVTNKSPNQPSIWMPPWRNMFRHFLGVGDEMVIFDYWRQSCDKSTNRLSTFFTQINADSIYCWYQTGHWAKICDNSTFRSILTNLGFSNKNPKLRSVLQCTMLILIIIWRRQCSMLICSIYTAYISIYI